MTTRSLVRASVWDADRVRTSLRDSTVAAEAVVGGRKVRAYVEPLLKDDGNGGLLQSIRLDAQVSRVDVRTESGQAVAASVIDGPAGVRVLVPAVDAAQRLSFAFPELGGESVCVTVTPQRQWTIHLIHHSHLDIGYTDPQGTVLHEHQSFLDSCLDLARSTDDWPDDARFRWCVEALWSLRQWTTARPAAQVEEFFERVRQGRIELTAMPFNLHTETCSTDELHELLRLSREVADKHGIRFSSAMQTDVPGAVVGLPDVLASNGIRYLSVAHNWAGRSVPHLVGGDRLPRLFRWRTPAGSSVLVWVTDTPHGLAYMEGPMLGFDTNYQLVDDLLPAYLTSLASKPYPYEGGVFGWPLASAPSEREPYPWDILHLRIQGHFADNAPPRRIIAETVRQWNQTWAYPRLRLSRNEDFFVDAENRLGEAIQTFTGDWSDWWVDGVGSGARPLALTRRAQATVADAQTVGALATVYGAAGVEDARDIYENMSLFDEHTWGASDPWTDGEEGGDSGEKQWHWKYSKALAAHDDALALLDRAGARLGSRLPSDSDALLSYWVVNTCSWQRTEIVRAFLPESVAALDAPVRVRDGRSGAILPHDEQPQTNPNHRDAGRFLLVRVDDVPSVGAVRLDVLAADEQPEPASAVAGTVMENEFLRVEVDLATAAVSSIVDKATGREWVDRDSLVGFNAYVYDRYASTGGFNHLSSRTEADEALNLLGERGVAEHAALVSHTSSATGSELVIQSTAPGTRRLSTTFRLPAGIARLDIENRIAKNATMVKESAYFAFPFAASDPVLRAEATGGVTGTGLPVVPGSAHHMRAVRRWVTVRSGDATAAWATQDAPLLQVGNIALPYAPFPPTLPADQPATLYSWVHNNLWDTNFPSQQAFDMVFRYSVAVGGQVRGHHVSAAGSRPLHAVRAAGPASAAADFSLVGIDDTRVRLVGLTIPSDGRVLLRLQSFAEEPTTVAVTLGFGVRAAYEASYLGASGAPIEASDGRLSVSLPPLSTSAILAELSD
ncbi:glycoside hydrolase family 38 C-terminal domain-containing protein [Fodinicola acaciae]|uniref:glycoside hydrolase family 38 N-terminal domain-containing protein n=1 Tax=Fodinicola acaciae TaxID=2681555 RepID=UPI0013D16FFF|nr:glycoside hydrolase family 38 C-terminal domain-containing protein [Fodinicola acaciae]